MKRYSKEFREEVVTHSYIHSVRSTSKHFGISTSLITSWRKRKAEGVGLENKLPDRTHLRKIDERELVKYLKSVPDCPLVDFAREFGCSVQAVSTALRKFGLEDKSKVTRTKKKGVTHTPST